MLKALEDHWPEYLMEAMGLGLFMVSASLFAVLLEHPASSVHRAIPDPVVRRLVMGLAMGLTAVLNVYSPWGKRSGAHLNPSLTLTFLRLGKIDRRDAAFYALFQFAGGLAGMTIATLLLGGALADPHVRYVATQPGPGGPLIAFVAEVAISFGLMTAVLAISNTKKYAGYTGFVAGSIVATWITIEAPFSGMSMNPARTFASAAAGAVWASLWIYFTAPLIGMLLASEVFVRLRGAAAVLCAKLHHENTARCIFRCNYGMTAGAPEPAVSPVLSHSTR